MVKHNAGPDTLEYNTVLRFRQALNITSDPQPTDNMSGFEALGGTMSIMQIIGLVLHHVQSVKDMLEETEAKEKRIYDNICEVKLIPGVESVSSVFINETVEESEMNFFSFKRKR